MLESKCGAKYWEAKTKKIVHFTKSIFKNCNIRFHTKYPTENTASTSVCTPKNLTLYYHCKLLTTPTLITPHMRIWVLRLQSGEDMGLSELTSHSKCSDINISILIMELSIYSCLGTNCCETLVLFFIAALGVRIKSCFWFCVNVKQNISNGHISQG